MISEDVSYLAQILLLYISNSNASIRSATCLVLDRNENTKVDRGRFSYVFWRLAFFPVLLLAVAATGGG
jgi:hypothetical protein